MAIQFRCAKCSQPIEVDDGHEGRTAGCPFCQQVVPVPLQSTYDPNAAAPPARPIYAPGDNAGVAPSAARTPAGTAPNERPPLPGTAGLNWEQLARAQARQGIARVWGNAALLCTAAFVVLIVIFMWRVAGVAEQSGISTTNPAGVAPMTPEMITKVQTVMMRDRVLIGSMVGFLAFALFGLVVGIVSLSQQARGNWRGLVAVIVCGLGMACVCLSVAVNAARLPLAG